VLIDPGTNADITESRISSLVESFYTKVRLDPEIGPIFNVTVDDWAHHLATLKDFWSSILLASGRYKGDPVQRHFQLRLDPHHFERWLALFAETAREQFPEKTAATIIEKSHRIAENLAAVNTGARATPFATGKR
jgi:hemoglobin